MLHNESSHGRMFVVAKGSLHRMSTQVTAYRLSQGFSKPKVKGKVCQRYRSTRQCIGGESSQKIPFLATRRFLHLLLSNKHLKVSQCHSICPLILSIHYIQFDLPHHGVVSSLAANDERQMTMSSTAPMPGQKRCSTMIPAFEIPATFAFCHDKKHFFPRATSFFFTGRHKLFVLCHIMAN